MNKGLPDAIEVYLGRVCMRADGIARVVHRATEKLRLEHAEELTEALGSVTGGRRAPVLADIRKIGTRAADRETRRHLASAEGARYTVALAVLVNSNMTRLMANFFFRFNAPPYAMRVFIDEKEALKWLEEHKE